MGTDRTAAPAARESDLIYEAYYDAFRSDLAQDAVNQAAQPAQPRQRPTDTGRRASQPRPPREPPGEQAGNLPVTTGATLSFFVLILGWVAYGPDQGGVAA